MENNKDRKNKISLEEIDKKNIYSVPDRYFDNLSYSIQERIKEKEITWFEKIKISPVKYAIPAFSIIIGLLIYLLLKPTGEQIAVHKKPLTNEILKKEILKKEEPIQKEENNTVPDHNNIQNKKDEIKITTPEINEFKNEDKNKDNNDSKNKITEPPQSPEQLLADVSKEDIKAYLAVNDLDESQMEESIIEN